MPPKKPDPKGGKTSAKKKEGGSSGGKAKKKKWSKGKVRDKLNNLVLFDKATYDKLYKEVPHYKLITPSVVSERLKVRGSLARFALQELLARGYIRQVVKHHSQLIYTRTTKSAEAEADREAAAKVETKKSGKKGKAAAAAAAATTTATTTGAE